MANYKHMKKGDDFHLKITPCDDFWLVEIIEERKTLIVTTGDLIGFIKETIKDEFQDFPQSLRNYYADNLLKEQFKMVLLAYLDDLWGL